MKNKPTKTIWVTRDGQRIPVKNMSDSHLINTVRLIRHALEHHRMRALSSMYNGLTFLNGEMANDALESEIRYLENCSDSELAEEMLGCEIYDTMLDELVKRELNES